MIRLFKENNNIIVEWDTGDLKPNNENQMAYWGFSLDNSELRFTTTAEDTFTLINKVSEYFEQCGLFYKIDTSIQKILEQHRLAQQTLKESLLYGAKLKEGSVVNSFADEFLQFLNKNVTRKLKDHQFKSALHLLSVKNGANFSVPGSGKTTVVLSVFHFLRQKNIVDALFVAGPPACFRPWRDEYKQVLGIEPKFEIFSGGDIDDRRSRYLTNIKSAHDLYLTSFQTLHRDWRQVRTLFSQQGIRFFYVIDEAHYIKQTDGAWASATLRIASFAKRRCILTGTPFPKSYSDAFNLFDILWPESPSISSQNKQRIVFHVNRKEYDRASNILKNTIGPLFYRVRKSDLRLAPQVFKEPIIIQMNKHEQKAYDSVLNRIQHASKAEFFRDFDLKLRLRRGRMMRLRQCLSYTKLLASALDDYNENLYEDDLSLAKVIRDYDEIETPGKITELVKIVRDLRSKNEKVVIWSNFVKTLELIHETLTNFGYGARLIYGATPLEKSDDASDGATRETYIREFLSRDSGIDILIANPAACAESISLHKTCSNAIYYDLSYNCAQYLQSLDRIHRVGGSEDKKSYYYFLQYGGTIDQDIMENLIGKAERMSQIIDQEYPIYSLDMFEQDDDFVLYERLFSGKP